MTQRFANDPVFAQLLAQAKNPVTRRSVLAGAGATAAALTLAACSPGGAKNKLTPAKDLSASEKVVVWDNWPYYMDGEADGSFPTLRSFEKTTGIKVTYNNTIDDNNTYFARAKNQLAQGADIGADTMCLTDWMAARLINSGFVQELQYDLLPNVTKNLDPAFKGSSWSYDSERVYSLPWKGIIGSIGYHKENYKKATGKDAPTSVADLWAPELKGKVVVLSEMRDTLGVMMQADGIDISKFTADDFHNTLDKFNALVSDGHIRGIKGNSYVDDLKSGDAVAGIVWCGDIVSTNQELGSDVLGVVLVESGSTFACDNFLIPMGAPHAANAHALINYYFDPAIAAELALAGVNYVPPVLGAKEIALKKNPALGENELVFPSAATYANLHQFRPLTNAEDREFAKAWSDASNGVV
ncbi:MAG: PotD/PotF family extracellular solute-binding protein [Micrococcales bacterium]